MSFSGANILDLSVLGVLLLSGGFALLRGFVREIFALGSWVGASLVAVFAYPFAQPWVHEHIKSEIAADAATALGLFCLTLIILMPIGSLLSRLVRGETLSAIDRSLGFVFGLVRGFLILCLLYLCINWMWADVEKQPDWLANAKTRPFLAYGAAIIHDAIPEEQREKAEKSAESSRVKVQTVREQVKQLEELSVPVPGHAPTTEPDKDTDTAPVPSAKPDNGDAKPKNEEKSSGSGGNGNYDNTIREQMNNLVNGKGTP